MAAGRTCVECEEPIEPKRLEAKPNARRCVECQLKHESRGDFKRSTIEVVQELNGWQLESLDSVISKGDE